MLCVYFHWQNKGFTVSCVTEGAVSHSCQVAGGRLTLCCVATLKGKVFALLVPLVLAIPSMWSK